MRLRISAVVETPDPVPPEWDLPDPPSAVRSDVEAALLEYGEVESLTVTEEVVTSVTVTDKKENPHA